MENNNQNYNFHLDRTVLLFFLFAILAASSLFAYRYSNREICEMRPFEMQAPEFRVGESISFVDKSYGAEKWSWSFDDSTDVKSERNPYHVYTKAGTYSIRLLVNGSCEYSKTVSIKEKRFEIDSSKIPFFEVPRSIELGESLKLVSDMPDANTWEWRFGESADIDGYENEVEYTYLEPGEYTVSLVVNGEYEHRYKSRVTVVEKDIPLVPIREVEERRIRDSLPPPPPVDIPMHIKEDPKDDKPKETEKAPFISNVAFGDFLVAMSKKKASPTQVQEHMCNQLNMPVIVNKKSRKFLLFCEKIRGKNIKVKDVKIIRDPDSGCITNIIIDINKRLF